MERIKEYIEDVRLHWDDAYWWADHQIEQTIIACVAIGIIGLAFKYAELSLERTMTGAPNAKQ